MARTREVASSAAASGDLASRNGASADHPFQDVPLAALMRSPLSGFSDDELLMIRLWRRHGPFYAAVWDCAGRPLPEEKRDGERAEKRVDEDARAPGNPFGTDLARKVELFVVMVDRWRQAARQGSPYELLGLILRETGYEAFLMGHPDGLTRLEHLDFLRGLLLRLGRGDGGANPLAAFLELLERAEIEEGEVGELPLTCRSVS